MSVTFTRTAPGGQLPRDAGRPAGRPARRPLAVHRGRRRGRVHRCPGRPGWRCPCPTSPSPRPGADVIARYGSHLAAVQAQFALTEGLPAIGLAVVAALLALAARRAGARRLSVAAAVSGGIAAVISLTQYGLGLALTGWALPGRAPGPVSGAVRGGQPARRSEDAGARRARDHRRGAGRARWPAAPVAALRGPRAGGGDYRIRAWVTSCCIQALAPMAYPAGMLLLIFVTGTGVALGRRARRVADAAGSHTGQTREDGGCPGLA